MRTEVQGWAIVHQSRTLWRGSFDGVFLAERDGEWLAGRQFTTQTRHDGFGDNGEWWHATYYAAPSHHEAYRALGALREYIRLSKNAACCWNVRFDQEAGEAVDRHWAKRVPLRDVADMSMEWVHPGLTGDLRSGTSLLPAEEAKYYLLDQMRRSFAVSEAFRTPRECRAGSKLAEAYQVAIGAAGPVHLSVRRDRFSLSHDGAYKESDKRWIRAARLPSPDRNGF
ncbi:hypothetical protein [Streptomyces lydicus]|uniref:hypothetical protein n=1 Tax=Streptomyces lydicus TaxID=47763 RepID=UPI0036EB7D3F